MEVIKSEQEKLTTSILLEEMEKLSSRMESDFMTSLIDLSGKAKDIECGTHIKIPMAAGYVSCFKSSEGFTMRFYMSETILNTMNQKTDADIL